VKNAAQKPADDHSADGGQSLDVARCPLCTHLSHKPRGSVALNEVWGAYHSVWNTTFSDEVLHTYGDATSVSLYECDHCSLQWFEPALEGDARFYQELHRGIGYEPWRWEFTAAGRRIADGNRVVEIGAGHGAFVRSIVNRSLSVEVLDKNPDAAELLRQHGIAVRESDVREDARERPSRADVVCAFQVLEHVIDVAGFLSALADIVVPGGLVMVSVPNRNRYRDSLEPMDNPPHHLTRWAPETLRRAADLIDLEVIEMILEPAELGYCRLARQQPVRALLTPLLGRPVADFVARASARLRMTRGRYARRSQAGRLATGIDVGHTMFAVLRRPHGRGP